MDPIRYYRRLLAYDAWANRETIVKLQEIASPPPRAVQLMGHIVGAEWLWYARVRREPPQMPVWPTIALTDCQQSLEDVTEAWARFLRSRTPDGLRDSVPYVNSDGESCRSTVEDILQHLVTHSAYHRAQIASAMRDAGETPVRTDFIRAAREGFISELSRPRRRPR